MYIKQYKNIFFRMYCQLMNNYKKMKKSIASHLS